MDWPRNKYWQYYKMVRSPPGTPKDLRCVNCKFAAGAGAAGVGLIASYFTAKNFMKNAFRGFMYGAGALSSFSLAAVAVKLAIVDNRYNEKLTAELADQKRRERRANREKLHNLVT